MPKTLFDLIAHCAIDQDLGRALQRYRLSHGAVTWSSPLDEYDGTLPVNSDKLLRG